MLGGCCPDRRSSRLLSPAEVATRLHIDEPEIASCRASYDRARVGPPPPATGASKPSWPSPSKQSSCILSPESHPLEHAPGPVFLARPALDAPGDNGFLLDLASRPPSVHPTRRLGQWLGPDTHTTGVSQRSRSVRRVCATPQTSFPDGH